MALALAACAASGAGRPGCRPRALPVANLSAVPVEQFFLGSGLPDGWGATLLGPAGLPSGASTTVPIPERGAQAVRVVWTDGRAVELRGSDVCRISRVTVLNAALRAE